MFDRVGIFVYVIGCKVQLSREVKLPEAVQDEPFQRRHLVQRQAFGLVEIGDADVQGKQPLDITIDPNSDGLPGIGQPLRLPPAELPAEPRISPASDSESYWSL